MANGNPLFNEKAFTQTMSRAHTGGVMTLQGTLNKTFFLFFLCVVGGMLGFNHYQNLAGYYLPTGLAVAVVALIIICKKTTAPVLSPVYAFGEGLLLGLLSAAYNAQYQGIVLQAVSITLLVFFAMLFIYRTGIIKVNRTFIIAITSATAAIALFYLISLGLMLFGVNVAYFSSAGTLSIVINVAICLVAAFNFLIDFHFIDVMTSEITAPKYMEWYAGFSLILTLVWLYVEILRLLGRGRSR